MATENPVDQLIVKLTDVNSRLEVIATDTKRILDKLNEAQSTFNEKRKSVDEQISLLNADIDKCNAAVDLALREGTE